MTLLKLKESGRRRRFTHRKPECAHRSERSWKESNIGTLGTWKVTPRHSVSVLSVIVGASPHPELAQPWRVLHPTFIPSFPTPSCDRRPFDPSNQPG